MKKILIVLLVMTHVMALASPQQQGKSVDELVAGIDQEMKIMEELSPQQEARLEQLYKMEMRLLDYSFYARTRGHWLLDREINRLWLTPLLVGLAAKYSHARYAAGVSSDLTRKQKIISGTLAVGLITGIALAASQWGINQELKRLDSNSEEEVLQKYHQLLCQTHQLSQSLGQGPLRDINGKEPVCK